MGAWSREPRNSGELPIVDTDPIGTVRHKAQGGRARAVDPYNYLSGKGARLRRQQPRGASMGPMLEDHPVAAEKRAELIAQRTAALLRDLDAAEARLGRLERLLLPLADCADLLPI